MNNNKEPSFVEKIPEHFRENYIEKREQDIEVLEEAYKKENFKKFEEAGHQIKGTGSPFGYEPLAELGRKMQDAAAREDRKLAYECLCQLKAWVHEQKSFGEAG